MIRTTARKTGGAKATTARPASSKAAMRLVGRLAPAVFVARVYRERCAQAVVVKSLGKSGARAEWRAAQHVLTTTRACGGHRNVVKLLDVHVHRDRSVFLIMEHCSGGDLLAFLSRTHPEQRVGERLALAVVRQVAQGLNYLHTVCGLAHRDVSLENTFVGADGTFKVGDLGLCIRADAPAVGCVGKTQYVAPEVIASPTYDAIKADVWSLGVLLFMLLTGAPLVEFAAPMSPEFQTFKAVGCRGMLRLRDPDRDVTPATVDLLAKMLECDPHRRLATMAHVLAHPAMGRGSSLELVGRDESG